jgi:hypothetical protein
MPNDPKQVNKPAPVTNTVTITLPPNMTAEQYQKSHQKWLDEKVLANKKMAADWRAMKATCDAHAQEYFNNRVKEYKAEGLDSSKLKVKK